MAAFATTPQLNSGIYTYPDIARILGIPYAKVHRWLGQYWEGKLGQEYSRRYSWVVDKTKAVSFHTLMELRVFYKLNCAGVKPAEILEAHKQLVALTGSKFPFATQSILQGLRSDGKQVLLYKKKDGTVLSLNGTKQFNMGFVLDLMLKIDFQDGMVSRYWPMGKEHAIICDPKRQFGHPVVGNTNIYPELLASMHRAGDSIKFLAANYNLKLKEVEDSIAFSKQAA
ncbi:MAG: DUF433 domain-containing protein [Flavobacteriales bacterium]|nr:DUF433 domain-containing protein [Flavobacteriales bacterium]